MSLIKYSLAALQANMEEELQQSDSVFEQLSNGCPASGQLSAAFLNNGDDHLLSASHEPLLSLPSQSLPEGTRSTPSPVWTCCECGGSGMATSSVACPHCGHILCSNCDVYKPKRRSELVWHYIPNVEGLDVNCGRRR